MLRAGRRQVFANVSLEISERLDHLKEIDPVLYSHSRVTTECLEAHLPKVERRAQPFKVPSQETPGRKARRSRAAA